MSSRSSANQLASDDTRQVVHAPGASPAHVVDSRRFPVRLSSLCEALEKAGTTVTLEAYRAGQLGDASPRAAHDG